MAFVRRKDITAVRDALRAVKQYDAGGIATGGALSDYQWDDVAMMAITMSATMMFGHFSPAMAEDERTVTVKDGKMVHLFEPPKLPSGD